MDLISMLRLIWRFKFLTFPVMALTLAGAYYMVAVAPPVYEATSSYLLINPPAPPSEQEIEKNPELAQLKTDNPYTRFGTQTVVVDVLARSVGGEAAREQLVKRGADSRYVVGASVELGFASPIVQVTGVGSSAESAISSARIVSDAVVAELERMQTVHNVSKEYQIAPLQVDVPDRAQLRVSGKLRTLVGVLAVGAIALFAVVSIGEAFSSRRRERRAAAVEPPTPEPTSTPRPAADAFDASIQSSVREAPSDDAGPPIPSATAAPEHAPSWATR